MRLGIVDFMICSNGFECWHCEFDQAMEDRFDTHPAFATKPARGFQPGQTGFRDRRHPDQYSGDH